jgi:DNA-directed RNA polymerase specialized sigma24 family protein
VSGSRGSRDDPGDDIDRIAREWALCAERERKNEIFTLVADAAQENLTRIACGMAGRIVGPHEAADIVNDVWLKVQANEKFDPDVGAFSRFFLRLVQHRCIDVIRKRREVPAPDDVFEASAGDPDLDLEYTAALGRIAELEALISAAIAELDLPPRDIEMLRMLIDPDRHPVEGSRPGGAMSAGERQIVRRLRQKIDVLAGLDQPEREAVSLLRRHHTVTAAAVASGVELPQLRRRLASAKRKIRTLFDLPSED